MNKIELRFDKATTRLAGNPYGRKIYMEQVKGRIKYNEKNCIIFPNQIEKIASSFTQGLFSEIIKKIGYVGIDQKIQIKARNEELEKTIYEDLLY